MKTFRIITAAAVSSLAAVLVGAALGAGAATKPVAFTATFNGKAVVRVAGDKADITSAQATGTGTPIGKATLTGKGSGTEADPCPLWGGPGTISASAGKLNFSISGGGACTDESAQDFSITGLAKFTGGTGKYAKAKGSFKITGTYNRGTGLFSVKLKGTFTV